MINNIEFNLEVMSTDRNSDRSAIFDPLIKYNTSRVGESSILPLNVMLRGNTSSSAIGGLWGHTAYGWLTIELLYIPEEFRIQGVGRRLINMAESEAVNRGCHSARLDTHEFQAARGFYEKCGYESYGELADYPIGYPRYFMRKSLIR